MRSKDMTPEGSPEEFLKRYKEVREKAGDNFTFQMFVEDVARGLAIEQRYNKYRGVFYIKKENLNPNYYWPVLEEDGPIERHLAFNCNKFCITPELLREIFGKEDMILSYKTNESKSYRYYSMGVNFEIDFITNINQKCAKEAIFDSDFFSRMENRGPLKEEEK